MDHLTELERDLETKKAALAAEQQKGAEGNPDVIHMLENEVNNAALAVASEAQRKRAEEIDEKVHAEEIPFAAANIDFKQLPAEVITLIDKVTQADRRRMLNTHAIELEQLEIKLKESDENVVWYKKAIESLNDEHDKLKNQYDELSGDFEEERTLRIDAESKRDAAVQNAEDTQSALDEALSEIVRLNSIVAEMERNAEYAERQEQPIIVDDQEAEEIRAAVEAVQKLYTKVEDWGSRLQVFKPDGTFEMVKRAELDEWEEVSEVTEETFREEAIIEQPPLYTTIAGLAEESSDMAGKAQEPVTRAEFEELKGRVNILFANQDRSAYKEAV